MSFKVCQWFAADWCTRFHLLIKLKPLVSNLRQIGIPRFHLLIILTATCREFAADWRTPVSYSLLCGRLAYPFCVSIKLTAACHCFAADWGIAVSSNKHWPPWHIVESVVKCPLSCSRPLIFECEWLLIYAKWGMYQMYHECC